MNFEIHTGLNKTIGKYKTAKPTPADKIALAQAIENAISKGKNYSRAIRSQSGWKPLNNAYIYRKERLGLSSKTWVLKGDTFKALTKRIQISGKRTRNKNGRELAITSIRKGYGVNFEYRMYAPSASGWPKSKQRRSWFYKNERVRPILETLYPDVEDNALDAMMDSVLEFYKTLDK